MTWRRLGVLVSQLPRESATFRALNPDGALWGVAEQLLAAVVDTVAIGNWQFASANVKKGVTVPQPEPIDRPGVKSRRCRPALTADQIHARLLAQRAVAAEGGDD